MPDLNLIDDDGGLETSSSPSTPAPAPAPKKRSSGGGGNKNILIILIIVILAAVAVFYLNKRGIIKLWGKKATPAVADMTEEDMMGDDMMDMQEPMPGGEQVQTVPTDTEQVAMLETPPVDEYAPVTPGGEQPRPDVATSQEPVKSVKPVPIKPDGAKPEGIPAGDTRLAGMTGEFTAQVGAFRERNRAESVVANLSESGYPAFVQTVPMKGADWYTVCIGKYPSRNAVREAIANSAAEIRASYVVARVR
ncbi:MAG: SPOR domain-containing protein [Bacteroidetes bacterium]|jgi:cell division septation protein DedD|nr:SPOR domain-containing protein [Bacteroidota bacterium]